MESIIKRIESEIASFEGVMNTEKAETGIVRATASPR